MLAYFFFGLVLVLGLILVARWFASADPKKLVRVVKWSLVIVAVIGILFFAVTRGPAALGGLLALLPFFLRWQSVLRRLKGMMGPSPGKSSQVETRFVRITLDHDSGNMSGVVLEGHFKGRPLDSLALPELLSLLDTCRAQDPQSAAILEAYLDRMHGPEWRGAAGAAAGAAGRERSGAVSREEALEILGLEEGASKDEIRVAHHRLMVKLHPDQGGSNWLSARINQARDVLLGK